MSSGVLARTVTGALVLSVALGSARPAWASSTPVDGDARDGTPPSDTPLQTPQPVVDTVPLERPAPLEPLSTRAPANPEVHERTAMSIGAAFVPGILLHGAGHWVKGDRATAKKLLLMEGTGLGMSLFGLGGLAVTGASKYFVGPLTTVTGFGVGLMSVSFLADVYGTVAPPGGFGIASPLSDFQASVGVTGISSPLFDIGAVPFVSAEGRLGRWRGVGFFEMSPETKLRRERVGVSYRLWQPVPNENWLEFGGAFTHLEHRPGGFSAWTGEVELRGRHSLGNFAPSLAGSFVQGNAGLGIRDVRHLHGERSSAPLLLMGFGYGFYVGQWSEVELYYNHRRDQFAGGILLPGAPAGFAGHFGLRGHWGITKNWGITADGAWGSSYVGSLALTYRWMK